MKNVTKFLSMSLGTVILAGGLLGLPGNQLTVHAQSPWESLSGTMVNVVATEGDGQISFTWDWDVSRVQEELALGNEWEYGFYTTSDLNEWANSDNVSLEDILVWNENTWFCDIPYDLEQTNLTVSGLQNGTSYYFVAYMDCVDGEFIFPALTPVAAGSNPGGNQEVPQQPSDDNTQDVPQQPSDNNTQDVPQQPSDNNTQVAPQQPSDNNTQVAPQQPSVTVQTENNGARQFTKSLNNIVNQINNAEAGTTIVVEGDSGFNALPNSIMQSLYVKGDVNLEFTYTYNEKEYTIVIPAGKAMNADIPWYGPLYLAGMYEK